MKKFDANGPSYGLFDLSTSAGELEPAMVFSDGYGRFHGAPIDDGVTSAAHLTRPHGIYRGAGKRCLDLVLVVMTLPFSLMIIGICALALWLEGGSPFYTQTRLGRNGNPFAILKLRTMVRDADAVLEDYLAADPEMRREWDELQKLRNDPRVTRIGQFLRATSLDELPQLLNVLKGDMSLIGPRPMMPDQLEMYGDATAYDALRPGITGLWQISSRNSTRFNYRQEVDGAYERSLSFQIDMTILVKTVSVVLRRTGC